MEPRPSDQPVTASTEPVRVTLVVPADPAMARVARLTASALAASAGLTLDAVDDVKIAVSEMLALLVGRGGSAPVTLVFASLPNEISIDVSSRTPPFPVDDQELELTNLVLDAVTASHQTSHDGDAARIVATVIGRDGSA
jgi:anti-sigma regulatory factor (Ser/Thr protein kinase)